LTYNFVGLAIKLHLPVAASSTDVCSVDIMAATPLFLIQSTNKLMECKTYYFKVIYGRENTNEASN